MKDPSQTGYVWAEPGPYEVRRKPRSPLRFQLPRVVVAAPLAFVLFMVFGFSYLVSPEPDVTLKPGAGFATVGGAEVALVPYQRSGKRGLVQMITQDMFQARLAAVELATGRALWDVQLSDRLSWPVRVLAAGERMAYVSTDEGLVILDLGSGKIEVRGGLVPGLSRPVHSRSAYGYDRRHRALVAVDADGSLRTIALDAATATPAAPEVAAAWAGKLSAQRSSTSATTASATEALLPGREIVQLRARGAAPGRTLVRRSPDGRTGAVGETVFHEAQLPLTPPPGEAEPEGFPTGPRPDAAAGGSAGFVVVHHNKDVNARDRALSVVSLETGQVTATLPVGGGQARALTSPEHRTLLYVRAGDHDTGEGLFVVGLDGRITVAEFGRLDFFGNP
ncbi:PA2928 family protein [Crossiella sp. NPDC003009]